MITFAIAAYNIENYIGICIESIIKQSKDEYEILVIDDGSTDNTAFICDEYAKKDRRIRVIHQENSGISTVRNRSIDEAKGEWITFVDGDDRLADGAYKTFIENTDDEFDIVYFDLQYFIYDNSISAYLNACDPLILKGEKIESLRLATIYKGKSEAAFINNNLRTVTSKAFKTEFLRKNNLLFLSDLSYGEDVTFSLKCLDACNFVKLVRRPFYLYRQRVDSAMHKYKPGIVEKITPLVDELRKYAKDDKDRTRQFYMECIAEIRTVFMLDMFHKENPKELSHRKADYDRLISMDWCRDAIEKVDISDLRKNDSAGYELIKNGGFDALLRSYKKRDRTEYIKMILNKTGISMILKPIRKR